MYISKVVIRNFRNFSNATFKLQKGVNTIIGENGSGKTNFFYALRLLLDDNLPPRLASLDESDFNRCLEDWRGHWVIIAIDFEELDHSEATQALSVLGIGHADNESKGRYSFFYRPRMHIRKKLFDLSRNADKNIGKLKEILDTISINDYESVFLGKGKADFSDENTYEKLVGSFEKIEFPDPEEKAEDYFGTHVPSYMPLVKEVACTFIKALRDVVSDLRTSRDNPLIQLLKGESRRIEVAKAAEITARINELNTAIVGLEEVQQVAVGIRTSLSTTVGTTYAPNLDIKSDLPNDIEKIMQSLTLWVGDSEDNYRGQIRELSLGGANLIYISLKLLEYEMKQSLTRAAHFLLIEEPEAHIHTHIQKTLFEKYSYNKTQVIISTHSTHISSASKISAINVLCKGYCQAFVYHPSEGLDPAECKRIERYLDAIRSTLLFAKGVILVEGDAELILIPEMFKGVFGISLDEIGISVINMSSAVFTNIACIFNDTRIRRRCSIITDLDTSIVELKENPKGEDEFTKSCRESQLAGEQRKKILDAFCANNRWVKPFYAKHTFEVDFLANGNIFEVETTLSQIYTKKADITKSSGQLNSDDIGESGKEILRLAKKEGKGWFALKIAEQVNGFTFIPDYILAAIAFASNHINDMHLEKMAWYRVRACANDKRFSEFSEGLITMEKPDYKMDSFLNSYYKNFPTDDLTKLRNLIGKVYA